MEPTCFLSPHHQATGSRLGLATNTVCALTIAIVVAFIHSWQLTLLILACVPFLIGANVIQMRAIAGHASKDQGALEQSGKVNINFLLQLGLQNSGNVPKIPRFSSNPGYRFSGIRRE